MTVGGLELALTSLDDDLPVESEFYDGSEVRSLRPMHIDLKGTTGTPSTIFITVA